MKRRGAPAVLGVLRRVAVAFCRCPRFVSDFRAQQFAYVGIYFIALLGLNLLTGYHRPDLARARRLHADRRLHDGDPDLDQD